VEFFFKGFKTTNVVFAGLVGCTCLTLCMYKLPDSFLNTVWLFFLPWGSLRKRQLQLCNYLEVLLHSLS